MSPCSYAATTATSQVIVLTKRHFLALSFQPRQAKTLKTLVPWERLELSRRKAQVPKTCVSTNSTTWATGAGTRTRTADLLITNQLLYQLSYAGIGAGEENRTPIISLEG